MPAVGRPHGSSFCPSRGKKQSLLHLQETISYSVVDQPRKKGYGGRTENVTVGPSCLWSTEYTNPPQEVVNKSLEENIFHEVITEAAKYSGVIDCQFAVGGLDPSHLIIGRSSGFFRGSTVVGIISVALRNVRRDLLLADSEEWEAAEEAEDTEKEKE
ncbi:hypothetical protein PENFLA_c015G09976 [Penicillium flavigenum]|uniref:Uncharacterized protein n=1 Tax=Penicillium flavigenum TaxID=254877 RepID=A0A1V6T3I7_9EURO|nr:hypothetical protein PENFLA_c015G09976 [Penicillium flavigenum]